MILLIDPSTVGELRVALLATEKRSAKQRVCRIRLDHSRHSFLLLATRFLASHGVSFGELQGIVVINGAGSFTSTRLAVSLANTLCWLYDIPAHSAKTEQDILMIKKNTKRKRFNGFIKTLYSGRPNITMRRQM